MRFRSRLFDAQNEFTNCTAPNFGAVAHDRGDYDQALTEYRKALAILEALGDRAGMASSLTALGTLYTENDAVEDGISFNLEALLINLELDLPGAAYDVYWLNRQREMLGKQLFQAVLEARLNKEDTAALLAMLDEAEKRQGKSLE